MSGEDTPADKQIAEAMNHLRQACICLSRIVIDEIQGHNEFNDGYRKLIIQALRDTLATRDSLDV